MGKVIGIDLGTTNSAVAIVKNGAAHILENADGQRTTPSVVSFITEQDALVGAQAKNRAADNPELTVSSIKRFMGTSYEERKLEREAVSYTTAHAADGGICVKIKTHERTDEEIQAEVHKLVAKKGARCGMNYLISDIDGREYSPVEISARILEKLKSDAAARLGEEVHDAVITVPAYFNDAQRQATRRAGKLAGLNVLRIVSEPTAAALAYGAGSPELDETILVFDLGGGTFDVSLLRIEHGVFRVLATAGDNHLGGDDWDWRLANYVAELYRDSYGTDLRENPYSLQLLREEATRVKIELSAAESAMFTFEGLEGQQAFSTLVTRTRFEGMAQPLLRRIELCLREIMEAVSRNGLTLDRAVLVGGSTRMPAVRKLVRTATGLEPDTSVNPDEAIALGAAIQGGLLTGEIKGVNLVDITPLSLGVETKGGLVRVLIPRHTAIPVQVSRQFMTTEDGQTGVSINVVQGERSIAADNKSLGTFKLEGIPALPAGKVKVEVVFDIDANNILNVVAREQITGAEQQLFITGSQELSEAEVRRILADADRHRAEDALREQQMTAEEEANSLVRATRRALSVHASQLGFEACSKLRMKTNRIADAIAAHTPEEELRAMVEDLRKARLPLEELANEESAGEAGWTIAENAPKDVREHWEEKALSEEGTKVSGKLW